MLAHVERDVVEDVAFAVIRVDPIDTEKSIGSRELGTRLHGDCSSAGADIDRAHCVVIARIVDAAVDENGAVIHDSDVIGNPEHTVDIVLDKQNRDFRGNCLDQLCNALPLGDCKSGERFIQQQNPGLRRQGQAHVKHALAAIGKR